MTKKLMLSALLVMAGISGLVLLPDRRSPDMENYASHYNLPPLGMMTPRRRYRLPYNPQYRGSGRRTMITTNALG